jgi:thiol:disulfide interchange protein DsbD
MCVALVMFAMAIHCASGLRDTRSMGGWIDAWLPPAIYPGQEAIADGGDDGHLSWIQNDIPRGMTEAKAASMPLFIDFTGYNCSNCRLMEMSVFPRPDVKRRLEQMIRVAAYTDGQGDKEEVGDFQREYQLRRFDTAALPYYAVIAPETDEILATFADMAQDPKDFVTFLDAGLSAYQARKAQRSQEASALNEDMENADAQKALKDDDVVILEPSEDTHQKEPLKPISLKMDGPQVDLTYPKLEGGEPFQLSSLRGSWVFLNFWADWCSPCKRELETDFPKALGNRTDIRLVTVAFNDASDGDKNRAFLKRVKVPSAVHLLGGIDVDEAKLPEAFGEQDGSLPFSYLISPEGRLVYTQRGVMHAEEITHLLAARPANP